MERQTDFENLTENRHLVKVGSRRSELALIQTRHVISLLKVLHPHTDFEIVSMSTLGDRVLNISLPKIGEKSLFTKDLEEALENGSVDFVVHSLKDLPTTLPKGMAIGAVLEREDPRDALVLRQDFKGHSLETLPKGSIIGTSSLRRTAQLSRNYPHLKVVDIRGNLNTRLKKLDYNCSMVNEDDHKNGNDFVDSNTNGNVKEKDSLYPNYAAIILAQAGLARMGWQHRISQVLSCKEVLYAVGQGALAIECRANNNKILDMLAPLNHDITYCRILAERSFLKTLGGGCSAPVAISTAFDVSDKSKNQLNITGAVWSLNGKTQIQKSMIENFEPTEWSNKVKSGKHKLSDCETLIENSTICKTSKKACLSLNANEAEENCKSVENSQLLCCRQKTINKTMEKAEPVEIENLINIHGKLFMSCPFSDKKGACPVRMPIGEEFMGTCPYLATKDGDGITETLVKLHPRRPTYDINRCPFMSNQIVAVNMQMECNKLTENEALSQYDIKTEPKAKNCPFLKQENFAEVLPTMAATKDSLEVCEETDEQLFCGLTKHFEIPQNVIEKCEGLGRKLAQSLIDEGALEVMKCSQDFIRSSVVTTSTITNA